VTLIKTGTSLDEDLRASDGASKRDHPDRPQLKPSILKRGLRWSDVALLGVAAAFSPLEIMAINSLSIGHPERILALIALVWVGGLAVVLGLLRFGVRSTTAVFSTFLVTALFMRGGKLLWVFGQPTGWLVMAALLGVTTALIARTENHHILRLIFLSLAVVLASGPIIILIEKVGERGPDLAIEADHAPIGLSRNPDVFLVILDGYVGQQTLATDFGLQNPAIFDALESRGFDVPESAWSSYPSTQSSLPGLLDMSYPLLAGEGLWPTTSHHLTEMIGGSNSLNTILRAAGYESVMIESGWSGSSCGPTVDRCVAAPLLDEAMFFVLARTVASPSVLESAGYAFTVGSQHTMNWLLENGPRLSTDDQPNFVFAHVMAPHPPFFLDPTCETIYSRDRSGVLFSRRADDVDNRRHAYLEQTMCLNDFMIDLSDNLDPSAVVIFVADHGTDQRNQLARDPSSWSHEDLIERFNIFLAVRGEADCSVGDRVVSPNIFRRLLSCMSEETLEDREPRVFKYGGITVVGKPSPVIEVDRDEVLTLLHS